MFGKWKSRFGPYSRTNLYDGNAQGEGGSPVIKLEMVVYILLYKAVSFIVKYKKIVIEIPIKILMSNHGVLLGFFMILNTISPCPPLCSQIEVFTDVGVKTKPSSLSIFTY